MEMINKRYRILGELGTDAFGTQYLAQDLALKSQKIILKVIHPQYSGTEYTQYFSEEFLALASVQHPNIQQDYRFDIIKMVDNRTVDNAQYFFTSEYIDTEKAIDYRSLSYEEVMKLLIELCYSINYLHFRDIAYKYLSFNTFWIFREDDNIKIKLRSMANIFGYAETERENGEALSQFLAPELRRGTIQSLTVDLFSLGIVAYYALNQKSYFDMDLKGQFTRYSVNPIIDSWIQRAIHYDAGERYQSIESFIEDFKKVCPYSYDFIDKRYYQKLTFNTKLVGRERLLKELTGDIYNRLQNLSGIAAGMVLGNPGLGKSRLLREVYYQVRLNNINAFTYEATPEQTGPYPCFAEMVREMTRGMGDKDELIVKYGSELVKLLPDMGGHWGIEPSEALREDREHLKIANRIASFIADFAQRHATLLVIDNINALNDHEQQIMDNLMFNDRDLPLFTLYSVDDEEALGLERLMLWKESGRFKIFELDNFSIHEASEHLKNVLGMSKPPTRLASYIVNETSGNPRYVEEVIKNLFLHDYIYIKENRRWMIAQDDYADIVLPENVDQALTDSYHSVTDEARSLLEAIAIYNRPIAKAVLVLMTGIDEEAIAESLENLIDLKILSIKYSDWGFTYDFYNKALGRLILHELDPAYRAELHRKAATIVENFYQLEGNNGDALIYHLENAGEKSRAVIYAVEMGKKMHGLSIYSQAVDFYQKAMDLATGLGDLELLCQVEKAIADIYNRTDEVDKALDLFDQVARNAESIGSTINHIDALHSILTIRMGKRETFDYDAPLDLALALSKEADYIDGILENGLLRSKLAMNRGQFDMVEQLCEEYLRLSFKHGRDYYIGRMLNQKGILADKREAYDEAFRSYIESVKYLERSHLPSESSRPLNNLGVIAINALGDIGKAWDYFKRAVAVIERYNMVIGKDVYLCNLGETYMLEDRIDLAMASIQEAESIAVESDDKEIKFQVYYNLAHCHMFKGNFSEAARYIKKIDQEYGVIKEFVKDIGYDSYDLLRLEYALKCRDFALAEQCQLNLNKNGLLFADAYSQFNLKLLRLYLAHLTHPEWTTGFLDLDYFGVVKSIAVSPIEEKLLRLLVMEMILDQTANQLYRQSRTLMDFYDGLEKTLDTPRLKSLESVLRCLQAEGDVDCLEAFLSKDRKSVSQDVLWRLYLILAQRYDQQENYYSALLNYLNSLDALKAFVLQMPEEQRMNYLTQDQAKWQLRKRIDELIHSIYHTQKGNGYSERFNSYEDYFALDKLTLIFENPTFANSVKKAYQKRFDFAIDSAEDLFRHFKTDQRMNIELVLKYQMQLCLAESACLYMVDEQGKLAEIINPTPEQSAPDLKRLLKNRTVGGEGMLLSSGLRFNTLSEQREAEMFIPLYRDDENGAEQGRRRYDSEVSRQILIGYLYFKTDKLLNNFTELAFEEIRKLGNLLAVLIDNYDLKKASTIDKLTGVYQRRYIEHQFKRLLVEAGRDVKLFSVVMADIDHFKNVNDLYGHRKGDEVLRKIGDLLQANVRKGDMVGRYGGEEFILLLPKTGEMDAYNVSEKLRLAICDKKLLGEEQNLTVSFGIATYPIHGVLESELIEKADKALYESKHHGRNQTTLWSSNLQHNNQRYDKLAGIMTGNLSTDTRVVKAIVDIIAYATKACSKKEKLQSMLSIIVDILEAHSVSVIYERESGAMVYTRNKGTDTLITDQVINWELYERYRGVNQGEFFIHWNEAEAIDPILKTPDWKSYCIVPILNGERRVGLLMATVPIQVKEFDFNDFNFIQTISGLLSKI